MYSHFKKYFQNFYVLSTLKKILELLLASFRFRQKNVISIHAPFMHIYATRKVDDIFYFVAKFYTKNETMKVTKADIKF